PNSSASGAPPTRVVRLFSRLNIGGPSLHVILLTAGLSERGYDTRLVVGREAPSEGNFLGLAREKGIDYVQLAGLGREIRPLADLLTLWQVYRLLRRWRPDIVHTHTAKAGVVGRIAARMAGVPIVVHTYHGHVLRHYFGPVRTALFRVLESLLSRVTDVVITVSAALRDDLVAMGVAPPDKIRVVPLGLELERFASPGRRGTLREACGVAPREAVVGIVGRLVPIKDVGGFLQAAALVRQARPGTRFAVVGDGEERAALERLSSSLGLAGAVSFLGWRTDLESVYPDLDVVVNSSLNEGTPVALIEALAAGRPVVATRVGGTPDLLGGGARGTLVPASDPGALATAILDTLADPDSARERARAGRDYVLAHHGSLRLVRDIDSLYRELLAPQAAVSPSSATA
ncbi:MAG TPA: GT4 family glycosyltransferase PelF, partial [Vicinamibacteria bacterium]|nr:GT4 family glycosyltransferase PelF [Vicinamibacteria bacterium]